MLSKAYAPSFFILREARQFNSCVWRAYLANTGALLKACAQDWGSPRVCFFSKRVYRGFVSKRMGTEPQSPDLCSNVDTAGASIITNKDCLLEWTNEFESVDTTVKELNTITAVLDYIIKISAKRNLHVTFHMLVLANELLKRRAEYLLQVSQKSFEAPTNRMTYPTCFLGEWLKFLTIKKKIVPGLCDYQCEEFFGAPPNSPQTTPLYPIGAPFHSGPSESAPRYLRKKNWTTKYELKYIHCAVKNTIDVLHQDIPIVTVLLKLSELFLIRYRTDIDYTPGVGNNLLKSVRQNFHSHAIQMLFVADNNQYSFSRPFPNQR
jgi:hypothetical protein